MKRHTLKLDDVYEKTARELKTRINNEMIIFDCKAIDTIDLTDSHGKERHFIRTEKGDWVEKNKLYSESQLLDILTALTLNNGFNTEISMLRGHKTFRKML